MKLHLLAAEICLAGFTMVASAANYQWTNTLGGNWQVAANWSPNAVPGSFDNATIAANGTYTVSITNTILASTFNLGGGSGSQTLVVDNGATLSLTNKGTVLSGGVMVISNASVFGALKIQAGGELRILGSNSKIFYALNLDNQGTVTWGGGSISIGSLPVTTFTNSGLWQITGDYPVSNGGGSGSSIPTWYNYGTVRKTGGTGQTVISAMDFVNAPGATVDVLSGTLMFSGMTTNPVAGSWTATAPGTMSLFGGNWKDAGGIASGTGTNQITGGTLILRTNIVPGLKLAGGNITLGSAFQQAGAITNLTLDGATLNGTNTLGSGILTFNAGSIAGQLTILPAGQLLMATSPTKFLYSANVINQGTVTWTDGSINIGGTPTTVIANSGLWLAQSTNTIGMHWGGGATPIWINTGILRKTLGTSTIAYMELNFLNRPGGLAESLAGTLEFDFGGASEFGGTFSATSSAQVKINSGVWTDAGGVTAGTGSNIFWGGTLNLRTNTIPGLHLLGGEIYITGTNTFQQAGVITNLTLDGTLLRGTNRVNNGTLTINVGSVADRLTIQPAGQLVLAGASMNFYSATLINQGTVNWNAGGINVGGTPSTVISNGGLWQINGDLSMTFGGGQPAVWTNSGTLKKTTGPGVATLTGPGFYNQPSGLVQVDAGTLQLTSVTTNMAGTLRLNGGTLNANGTLAFNGGILDGAGVLGANALTGGTISPGLGGTGLMRFSAGLNLSTNATLTIDGTGSVPGVSYDQLSVTGAVALGSCKLQVTSLPSVALGGSFVIVTNDGVDAVTGTFSGLAENASLTVGLQTFSIHYAGGSGNDVTLVRVAGPPVLISAGLTNGKWQFSGVGSPAGIYAIQATTNFVTWTNLGFATGDLGGNISFIDTNAFRFKYRYYRTTN